ncbi:hypothetical protein QR680_009812 [Steinernema hermaphroditum]|uniref:Uncharacterized protein n=1 Tax=Steinernema hermaphroditum TaxID=289476 RepID=A0AA39ILP6_9BILA|nr:hypothetical protein QR680_009812 [Steinernema hermaphroditum]
MVEKRVKTAQIRTVSLTLVTMDSGSLNLYVLGLLEERRKGNEIRPQEAVPSAAPLLSSSRGGGSGASLLQMQTNPLSLLERRLSSVSTQTPTKLVAMMEASESCKTPSRSNAFILPSYSVLHDQIIQELATDNSLSAVQRMAKKRALDALMEELRT